MSDAATLIVAIGTLVVAVASGYLIYKIGQMIDKFKQ
jgi:hypothetical protein